MDQAVAQPSGGELLDCLASSVALADAKAAKLVELCSKPRSSRCCPTRAGCATRSCRRWSAPISACSTLAGWCMRSMFDEAADQLSGLGPADVVAPAELLFYQGVVYYRLLNQEKGMKAINDLLDGAETSPRRYVHVARLMQADLEALKPDTLDHIARRMEDIQRRLELGRAGPKVRKVEDGVIESLDKLIKKLEDEQQDKHVSQQRRQSAAQASPPTTARPWAARGPAR